MQLPFRDKIILVVGASSGIGRSIAIELSKLGATLILSARNFEQLENTKRSLSTENNQNHKTLTLNLLDSESFQDFIRLLPVINGIVHCAGVLEKRPINNLNKKNLDLILNTNFVGPTLLTSLLLKNKKLAEFGSIVFITSIAVEVASIGNSIYMASKSALKAMAKGMALELAPKNIRVNCVEPALIETDLTQKVLSKEQLETYKSKFPLKRFGKSEEIAHAVIFLLSDSNNFINLR